MSAPPPAHLPFRVLVVCTGNICRSPLAAHLLRAELAGSTPPGAIEVSSAGTGAVVGHPMDDDAAAALAGLGHQPDPEHRGQQVIPPLLRAAGLVLTATREHRSAVVRLEPTAVRKTFTLRELARIAPLVEPPKHAARPDPHLALADLVHRASALRGLAAQPAGADELPPAPAEDDIEDPYRGSPDQHARVAAQIAEAVRPIAALLGGAVALR